MDSLNEKVWLLVEVVQENKNGSKLIKSELFDGTEFKIVVPEWAVRMLPDPIKPGLGWLQVDSHGESNNRTSITLPAPALDLGHRVSVNSKRINKKI